MAAAHESCNMTCSTSTKHELLLLSHASLVQGRHCDTLTCARGTALRVACWWCSRQSTVFLCRWAWPLYWIAQGTMFWALFVVGHDCGHQSFSNNRHLNDLVGNISHASILVPYHGWRVSHRKHHGNHGHVENDESWHPTTESQMNEMVGPAAEQQRL
eukprot:GHRQ01034752.1.p1 GENE.GHRQ01034752.1~~GHRQ01034752.1.p1  ORF type:complete len:158 (-),score=3.34 GHRQ01034752.1:29-502(-)